MKSFTNKIIVGSLLTLICILTGTTLNAQEPRFRDQAWRYGLNFGLNYNMSSLGDQDLHLPYPNFAKNDPNNRDNVNGKGLGLYGGIFGEYLSTSWWGIQLRASWDMRDAVVKDTNSIHYTNPTPVPEFTTRMSYISFEPALRIDQHVIPNLSITVGGLIGVNMHGTYDYKRSDTTALNQKVPDRPVASLGITGGLAYDIELMRGYNTSVYLAPFIDYSWMAAQRKSVVTRVQNSSNDIWSTQTIRVGVRLSWEHRNPPEEKIVIEERIIYVPYPMKPVEAAPGKKMVVIMPCLLYTSPSPRDRTRSRMPSSA